MLIYLGCAALATFIVNLAVLILAVPSPLVSTHLVFAIAVLPLIVGAMTHFIPVLTRSGEQHRAVNVLPLALQVAGVLVVLHCQGWLGRGALHAAAGGLLLACAGFCAWMFRRAWCTIGRAHPGWRWYLAAVGCLVVGLALVPAMDIRPEWWPSLRLLHLHLNTLGFIGLTAIGTLQVLMPTVLSGPDSEAAARLNDDLFPALAGVCLVALGAAVWSPAWWAMRWLFLAFGVASLFYVVARLGLAWVRRYGWRILTGNGAAVSLAGALFGFLLLILLGVAHGFGFLNGRDAVLAFVVCFLMPLVSGALAQLLPVWCTPGRRTGLRDRMHVVLATGGGLRTILFMVGGGLLAIGQSAGAWLSVAGLLLFLFRVVRALRLRLVSVSA